MVYIHAVALDCALGARPQDILANLGKNEAPGFTPDSHWLLSGEPLAFGHMTGDLPAVPENLAKHQSRNNRALMSVFRNPVSGNCWTARILPVSELFSGPARRDLKSSRTISAVSERGNPTLISAVKRRSSVTRLNSFPPG